MILVGVVESPNSIGYSPDTLKLNEEGDLNISMASTLIYFPNPETGRYIFLLISREGVKSINGKPIRKD
jgi:hypothetical protein